VPVLPSLGQLGNLLVPAASLALVGLVQGAAIGQSIPNPDGSYPDASGDFRGQGIANLVSGVLQGMPVGGSMSGTALVVAAGGRGRYANLTAAAVMVVAILVLAPAFGYIAMPSLSALLVLIGVRTFKPDQVVMVWRTGRTQATVMTATFLLTLLVPMQYAVLSGVGIAVVLFVARQSNRVSVKRWTFAPGAPLPTESTPPAELPAGEVVVLTVYGSLFFASATVFESQLPAATPASRGSVVVLRLRGKEELGSTFIKTIIRYHDSLAEVGSHLVLTGLNDRLLAQLRNTGAIDHLGPDNIFPASPNVGESLQAGLGRAQRLREPA
jgi:SulP family sulfate permease